MNISQRSIILSAILFGIPMLFFLLPPTEPYMVVTFGVVCHAILWFMDCAVGAHLVPVAAPVMWVLVGAILGASLGFWTIAPSLGMRRLRRSVAAIPLILIGGLTLADALYSISQPANTIGTPPQYTYGRANPQLPQPTTPAQNATGTPSVSN